VRKITKVVPIGDLRLGGSHPIAVQTMWDRPLSKDLQLERKRILELKELGCDIIRFAIPDKDSVAPLGKLAQISAMPLVADIHFDYRLALAIMEYPIAKIRINPGNIGADWKVEEVVRKAADKNITLRVGANHGSLPSKLKKLDNPAEAMVLAAESQLEILERLNFKNLVVSLKSSSVQTTIEANRLFSKRYDYPLHLGVTEAGPLIPSIVKSSLALGTLIQEGIGDTLRISISDSLDKEVAAGTELLAQLGLQNRPHVNIISCPRCGRTQFDTHGFTEEIEPLIRRLNKEVSVAIMGCEVNGPGEASHADLGIAGSGDKVILFRKGKIIRREPLCNAKQAFLEELEKL